MGDEPMESRAHTMPGLRRRTGKAAMLAALAAIALIALPRPAHAQLLPITPAPEVTITEPADGSSVATTTPLFRGTAGTGLADSGTVTVKLYPGVGDGSPPVETLEALVRADGTWSVRSSGLSEGSYTARAEQGDLLGSVGRASAAFAVDVTPPETVIDSGPRDPINSASASFGFHASETGSTFECSLDGAAYAACASGQKYSGLADGRHRLAVRARDRAGNVEATPATFEWTVDTAAPAVTLTVPANGATVSDATPSLSGAAGMAAGDSGTVTVRIYAGGSASGTPVRTLTTTRSGGTWSATASPQLADGTYTAQAEQRDAAGNLGRSGARTFAVDVTPAPPVIAAAGDIACDPLNTSFGGGLGSSTKCRQKHTSDLLVGQHLAAVLALGDLQYACAGHKAFMRSYDLSWGRLKPITFPAVGNHEYDTSGGTDCDTSGRASGYFAYFGAAAGDPSKGYYSFDVGSWHIVALNSNRSCAIVACKEGSAQEQWLKADLAAHPSRCTLAYWHAPRFTSAGNTTATLALWRALYTAGADVIVNGHIHNYERFAPMNPSGGLDAAKGIRQFVVGTGGASHGGFKTILPTSEARDATTYGVLKLTLRATGYDWRFVPEAGKTFTDSGSTECH